MLSTMRKRVRIVMIVVAAAFVLGFLGSELWNILARRGSSRGSADTRGLIAEIGKHQVRPEEYRAALAYITEKYKNENRLRDLTNEDYAAIEQQAWQFLVGELTWAKVLEDARIRVTQEEILQIMQANPPEELRDRPELMTDGKFDQQKYVEMMNRPENRQFFAKYYQDLLEMLPKEKFRIDAVSAWRPTQLEIQDNLGAENTVWSVASLYFGPGVVADPATVEPTEAEIRQYYDQHKDEFRSKEVRRLEFALFMTQMSPQDSAEAREQIEKAWAQLQSGESFNLTMLDYSELAPDTIPVKFPRARLDPATDTVVKRLKPGEVSAPFRTTFGWQIIALDSVRGESVALRRIVVRFKQGGEALAALRDSVRSFIERSAEMPFESLATIWGVPVIPARPMIDGKLNLAGMDLDSPSQIEQWAKRAKPGAVMPTAVRGRQGYYVFRLAEVIPAGVPEFEKVKNAAAWRVRQQKEKQQWQAKAQEAVAALRAGKSFEDYAAENKGVELQNEQFVGLSDARRRKGAEFAGALLVLRQGERVGPVVTDWGAFIIRCDQRAENTPTATDEYVQRRQSDIAQMLLNEFLKTPEIKDYRDGLQY